MTAVASDAMPLGNPTYDVHIEGQVPALRRTADGKTYVAWYEKFVPADRRRQSRDFVCHGFAYALAHPGDSTVAPIDVDGIAVIVFNDVRVNDAKGGIRIEFRPISMQLRDRNDERCRSTARVIARLVWPHRRSRQRPKTVAFVAQHRTYQRRNPFLRSRRKRVGFHPTVRAGERAQGGRAYRRDAPRDVGVLPPFARRPEPTAEHVQYAALE